MKRSPEYCNKNLRLCSNHFEDSEFVSILLRNRLNKDAIPTVFDVPNPPHKLAEKRKKPNYGESHKKIKMKNNKTPKTTNISEGSPSESFRSDADKTSNKKISMPEKAEIPSQFTSQEKSPVIEVELNTSENSTAATASMVDKTEIKHGPKFLPPMDMSEDVTSLSETIDYSEIQFDESEKDTNANEDEEKAADIDDGLNNLSREELLRKIKFYQFQLKESRKSNYRKTSVIFYMAFLF